MTFVLIFAGLVLLVVGGDVLVRGAVTLATRMGVSPLLVGLTVVGFGTSTPELVTSLDAALSGAPGISIGNVVGSNIANILLILAVAALIMPVAVSPKAFWRDAAALSLATLAGAALVLNGELTRIAGALLLGGLVTYIVVAFRSESRGPVVTAAPEPVPASGIIRPALLALVGIATTIVGARLLVSGAIDLATGLGVSDSLIGLTIVAVGTSLPELVTAVIAALRRQGDIAFGNVIGSNIYNILGILGVTALVHPIAVPAEIAVFDIGAMLAATLALVVLAFTGWQVSRREGAALLIAYVGYLGWLVANA